MSTRLESYCVPQIIVDYVIQEIYVHIIRYCFSQICETFVMLSCVLCYFLIWCPASGVVLDRIDSWSLPSSLCR